MTKKKHSLIIVTLLIFAFAQVIAIPGTKMKGGVPSDLISEQSKSGIRDIRFVLHEQADIRLLFCEPEDLNERIGRSVCVFDLVGLPMGKNDAPVTTKEISLGKGATVAEVLKKAGMGNWHGGRPQIRVIGKNSIVQSPIRSPYPNPEVSDFLNYQVSPGDFVILATIN